jgi:hypothetical protein
MAEQAGVIHLAFNVDMVRSGDFSGRDQLAYLDRSSDAGDHIDWVLGLCHDPDRGVSERRERADDEQVGEADGLGLEQVVEEGQIQAGELQAQSRGDRYEQAAPMNDRARAAS